MKILHLLTLLTCLMPFFAQAIELGPKEKEKVLSGKLSKDVKWRKKFVWPMVTIKALIPGTPEQNMALFADFDKHAEFVPDLMKSKVVNKISPTQIHVYAELKVPWPVNKSAYTTNNVITTGTDGTKTLTWNLVKADLIKATDGHVIFAPYEGGKSLMEYQSQIVPDSSFSGMFKNKVPEDVEKSVEAIIKHLGKNLPASKP